MEKTPENTGLSEDAILESPSPKSSAKSRQATTKKASTSKKVKAEKASGPAFITDAEGVLDPKELLRILMEVKHGNFNVRMPIDKYGIDGKICDTLNDIISINKKLTRNLPKHRSVSVKKGSSTNASTYRVPRATGIQAWRLSMPSSLTSPILSARSTV